MSLGRLREPALEPASPQPTARTAKRNRRIIGSIWFNRPGTTWLRSEPHHKSSIWLRPVPCSAGPASSRHASSGDPRFHNGGSERPERGDPCRCGRSSRSGSAGVPSASCQQPQNFAGAVLSLCAGSRGYSHRVVARVVTAVGAGKPLPARLGLALPYASRLPRSPGSRGAS